ncbi:MULTISPECIES: glycosyltransferase family 2 protein [Pseudonocardia]|uniref:Glycosyl hydrolase n=2 Tax=Pseudonocardia TaxID=1847 RepID=A0ABQ0RTW2_9PSEU|nr:MULTISPECIES: glycosyltransferase [Pseudonocardia]OSY41461.1 putative glycosyltransferase EpsE [Pseudonocardia autotrophica]TDN71418.1 glycosyltransferase involved in cell wall biosynthesis [Pseudonocardia autotrophica]BBG02093.1 glycosyl hydrolase [Pseudonocardia autotrophica]GEC24107.1 glycosyl hydrolase [Pseudonocardia saturnea]
MRPGGFLPSVSVCIPVYNGEAFLAETIRSILEQTLGDFELVVLDNNSSDATWQIATSFRDRRIRVEHNRETLPQGDNWNRAVHLCRAPLVKLVCADDLLHPRCLELQVPPMRDDPSLAVVAARRHMIDEQSRVLVPRRGLGGGLVGLHSGSEVARRVIRNGANPIGEPGNVLFRREQFVTAGGWRGDRRFIMDLDLWMRLLQYGDFLGLPETLAAFRISRGSVSAEFEQQISDEQQLLLDELGGSGAFDVRPLDVRIGRLALPFGRARRKALFKVSRIAARKDDRVLAEQQEAAAGDGR